MCVGGFSRLLLVLAALLSCFVRKEPSGPQRPGQRLPRSRCAVPVWLEPFRRSGGPGSSEHSMNWGALVVPWSPYLGWSVGPLDARLFQPLVLPRAGTHGCRCSPDGPQFLCHPPPPTVCSRHIPSPTPLGCWADPLPALPPGVCFSSFMPRLESCVPLVSPVLGGRLSSFALGLVVLVGEVPVVPATQRLPLKQGLGAPP